jgi:hypothetical protein
VNLQPSTFNLQTCKPSTFKPANLPALFLLLAFILSACGTATPAAKPQTVNVYATSAAQPWLTKLYTCAENSSVVLNVNAESPEIYLRVGESENFVSPAYQIGEEEILVVVPRESSVQNLTLAEVQELFAQESPPTPVWVYASGVDLQRVFDQLVMQGRSVSSSAKIAVSPQNMSSVLKSDPAAVGILPRHFVTGDLREVFSAGEISVLAVTKSAPQGAVIGLISCLQNN